MKLFYQNICCLIGKTFVFIIYKIKEKYIIYSFILFNNIIKLYFYPENKKFISKIIMYNKNIFFRNSISYLKYNYSYKLYYILNMKYYF